MQVKAVARRPAASPTLRLPALATFRAPTLAALGALLLAGCAGAAAPAHVGIDVRVSTPPAAVAIQGSRRLVYELHLAGRGAQPVRVQSLVVLDAERGSTLAALHADTLAAVVVRYDDVPAGPGPVMVTLAAAAGADPLTLAPGERAVVYLEIDVPASVAPPQALLHRIVLRRGSVVDTVAGAPAAVRFVAPPVLGPPVRGGPWVAVYHPSWPRGHRRVFYAVDGRERIPGRFAIDWILVDADGRTTRGDPDVVANWLGHGADVLAVADAVVVSVRDDVAESARMSTHPDHPLEDATGNYITLELGAGQYVFYEHLAPGSVRVAPGDRVRRGQPIAVVGYTGHTTGPHLHLHVADANSPLGAEGVPFVLQCFHRLGAYERIETLGTAPWIRGDNAADARRAEMPAPNTVVDFAC